MKKRNTPSGSAKVTKTQVKQMIKASEGQVTKKFLNSSVYGGVVPTGTIVTPALPAQGATNGEREGDSLHIDFIDVRFTAVNEQASISINDVDCLRLICLQARAGTVLTPSYSAAPTTGVLDLGSGGALDETSFINFNAANETFYVLMDRSFPVNFGAANGAINHAIRIKPKVAKINFTPTTTTALCGQIYWLAQTITGNVTLGMEQRVVYHDL